MLDAKATGRAKPSDFKDTFFSLSTERDSPVVDQASEPNRYVAFVTDAI